MITIIIVTTQIDSNWTLLMATPQMVLLSNAKAYSCLQVLILFSFGILSFKSKTEETKEMTLPNTVSLIGTGIYIKYNTKHPGQALAIYGQPGPLPQWGI